MRKVLLWAVPVLVMSAGVAGAQMSQSYRDWPNGPEGFLLTRAEDRAYQLLTSDVQAQAFIDVFWAKRDPDLKSADNDFKINLEYRVEYADDNFGVGDLRGAMTDRGRVLILMGFPTEVLRGEGPGVGRGRRPAVVEVWKYEGDDLPAGFKGDKLEFMFSEAQPDSGDFRLDRGNRQVMRALDGQPEALLLHPDLTEVPEVGIVSGSEAASEQELALFDLDPRPWPEGAHAFLVQGVRSLAIHPLWLFVDLPGEVPPVTRIVGRARPVTPGAEVRTFALEATSLAIAGGRGYELSIPLGAGDWNLDLAMVGEKGPLAVTTLTGTVKSVPREGVYLSPWYWGAEARQDPSSVPGDPFNLGGWHVIPRLSNTYTNKDSLTYFCFVLRPIIPEGQQPVFTLSTGVYLGERKLTEQGGQPANLSRVGENLWMFGHSLPLSFIRRPGEYSIELTLEDSHSDAKHSVRIPVIIAGE